MFRELVCRLRGHVWEDWMYEYPGDPNADHTQSSYCWRCGEMRERDDLGGFDPSDFREVYNRLMTATDDAVFKATLSNSHNVIIAALRAASKLPAIDHPTTHYGAMR